MGRGQACICSKTDTEEYNHHRLPPFPKLFPIDLYKKSEERQGSWGGFLKCTNSRDFDLCGMRIDS